MDADEQMKELREANDVLTKLLAAPEYGCHTWMIAVANQVARMARVTGYEKETD